MSCFCSGYAKIIDTKTTFGFWSSPRYHSVIRECNPPFLESGAPLFSFCLIGGTVLHGVSGGKIRKL